MDDPNDCNRRELTVETTSEWTGERVSIKTTIRSGYLAENPTVPFRGNVIYYEGLGDSMVNHAPLFRELNDIGFRVICFDYMGQGGSSGSMNDTRIAAIGTLGDKIWSLHARDLETHPKKSIIGWSTGGLAAYLQAQNQSGVSTVVLLAPGIAPNWKVGEQHPLQLKFNQITLPTLTTQIYSPGVENPHIDPIKPNSPLEVTAFAYDLVRQAWAVRGHAMSPQVRGLVLLSGDKDTYVNAKETFAILQRDASHFSERTYVTALHEIDNEAEPTRGNAHADILNFLMRNN